MVQDPIVAVGSYVIETLRGVISKDKDLGLKLSKKLFKQDKLLKVTRIENFVPIFKHCFREG